MSRARWSGIKQRSWRLSALLREASSKQNILQWRQVNGHGRSMAEVITVISHACRQLVDASGAI